MRSSSSERHAEVAEPLEQAVQHVDGGPRVGQRAVVGRRRRPGSSRARVRQLAVGRLVAGDAPGGPAARCRAPGGPATRARCSRAGGLEERRRRTARCARPAPCRARELEERRQRRLEPRGAGDHRVGDAGQHRDERRDRHARVDQRLELAEHLAAAHLDRADLGDLAASAASRRWSRGRPRRTSPRAAACPSSSKVACTASCGERCP